MELHFCDKTELKRIHAIEARIIEDLVSRNIDLAIALTRACCKDELKYEKMASWDLGLSYRQKCQDMGNISKNTTPSFPASPVCGRPAAAAISIIRKGFRWTAGMSTTGPYGWIWCCSGEPWQSY